MLLIGNFLFIREICLDMFLSKKHHGICTEFGDSSVQS